MSQELHTPESITKLGKGLMASRVLLAGAELDYTAWLHQSRTRSTRSCLKKMPTGGMNILLDALSALGLLVQNNNKYQAKMSIAPLLTSNSPDSILPVSLHMCTLWKRWPQELA